MADVLALSLLLDANYIGRSAFGSMIRDIEGLTAATSGFSRVGQAFKVAGDMMIAAGLATAVGITYAVKAASDYETAINRIVSVTPDLQKNTQLLAQLKSQIGTTGSQYGINPTDLAKGSYFLFSSLGALGANSSQLLQANIINELAQYSRASGWPGEGGIAFSDAAQVLPRLFAASGQGLGQWGGDMGTLTFLENRAHMTQEQLANAMNAFLPAMTSLGINFSDAATLMAGVATAGRTGAPGGRETLSALTLMFSGKTQQAQLAALGLSSSQFFGKDGKMLPIDQVLNMLRLGIYGHAKSPADVLSTEHNLFGQVGLRALGSLLAPEGWAKYQNLIGDEKKMGIYGNNPAAALYMRTVSDNMMKSPGAQWDRFKATMELLAITVGDKVLPSLIKLGDFVDKIAMKAVGFINAHPNMASALALGAVPGLLGGGFGLKGIGGLLQLIGGHDEGVIARNAKKMEDFLRMTGSRGGGPMLNALQDEGWSELGLKKMPGKLGAAGWYTSPLSHAEFAMREANYKEAHDTLFKQLTTPPEMEKTIGGMLFAPFKNLMGAGSKAGLGLYGGISGLFKPGGFESFLASGMGLNKPIGGAAQGVGTAFKAVADTVQHPITALKTFGGVLKDIAGKGFSGFVNILKAGIPALFSLGGAAIPIIAIILAVVGAITIAVLLFTRFRSEGQRLGQMFASVFGPIIRQVIATVVTQFHQIQAAWKQVEPQVASGIHQLVNAFISAKPFFVALGLIFSTTIRFIITAIGGLVIAFIHALPNIIGFFTGIMNIIADVTNLVIAIFTGKWGQIPGILWKLVQDIWHTIVSGFMAIVVFIGDFIGHIIHFFVQLWDELTGHSIIPDMIKSIIDWFKSLPGKALDAIQTLTTNLVNFFKNLAVQAGQWGINLIQGLINGIKGMAGNLGSAISGVAGGAINGFKNLLGIHSPSTVFHEFGRMTVAGYAQGIQAHARDIDQVHSLFGLGRVGTLRVDNLQLPGQQRQQDTLEHFKFTQYVEGQRQRRMMRYAPDLDALAYQERIGSQYTA